MKKKNDELVRVNMNIPKSLVDQVKVVSQTFGVNTTTAYILLLSLSLDIFNSWTQENLPEV